MGGNTSTASSNVVTLPYVVRQEITAFIVPCAAGALFVIAPFFPEFGGPIWIRISSVLMGMVAITVGCFGYRLSRIGVRLDEAGIWTCGLSIGQLKLIPWTAIVQVRKITFNSPEGEHEGVLVGINTPDCYPFGEQHAERGKQELSRLIGPIEFPCAVLLNHDEWDWDIDEFLNLAQQCLNDRDGGYQPSSLES